jgi:hypothetical protein
LPDPWSILDVSFENREEARLRALGFGARAQVVALGGAVRHRRIIWRKDFEAPGEEYMSKAVLIRNGQTSFLMETDPSVEIPPEMAMAISSPILGVPKDMQPVVSLESLEGNFTQISDLP